MFGKNRRFWTDIALFGQNGRFLDRHGCIWTQWSFLTEMAVFGQMVVFGQTWLYLDKMVVFGQTWLSDLDKMVVFGQT